MSKNIRIDSMVPDHVHTQIKEISEKEYDGNFSMAVRKIIVRGLATYEKPDPQLKEEPESISSYTSRIAKGLHKK